MPRTESSGVAQVRNSAANGHALWHLLQVSDVLDLEFSTAFAERTPLIAWQPHRTVFPWFRRARPVPIANNEGLRRMDFPLLKGYARPSVSNFARTGTSVAKILRSQTPHERDTPLICTVPYFASVAEHWRGPVVYWLTDLIAAYAGTHGADIPALDRRMCARATLVCPNSERLRTYLIEQAGCDPEKIFVLPNATRAANVLQAVPTGAGALPAALRGIPRPIAGVIGNLAGNMDWELIEEVIHRIPSLTWAFVGPTSMLIPDPVQDRARSRVMQHERTHFVGKQPYGELQQFARAFDVAVLPYRKCEPTYSGSSTRFYEHLCACRPMVATDGLEELVRKPPLLRLTCDAPAMIQALRELEAQSFDDGLAEARWQASQRASWQVRAADMKAALAQRLARASTEMLGGTDL